MSVGSAITSLLGAALPVIEQFLNVIPQGQIGAIPIYATLEETGHDTLQLTEHPVEAGAEITDHAFFKPAELTMHCGWSNATTVGALGSTGVAQFYGGSMSVSDYVSGVYSQLLALQQSLQPFTVQTSIRQYTNMMITSLSLTRDQKTSQALMLIVGMRQILYVSTQTSSIGPNVSAANQPGANEVTNYGQNQLIAQAAPSSVGSYPPGNWSPLQP